LKQPTFGLCNTTEAFWHRASGRLSNRDNLLFDIINEPHDMKPEELARHAEDARPSRSARPTDARRRQRARQ